jgi:hypothetical protein
MKEFWRNVWVIKNIDYTWLYQVSNLGEVKSLKRVDSNNHPLKERILKPWIDWWGYKHINLCKNWIVKKHKIHRLVLNSFKWYSKLICNHKDWIKTNNRLDNLEYCNHSFNNRHAYKIWLKKPYWKGKKWKDSGSYKLVNQYDLDWNFMKTWFWFNEIQRELWIYHQNIIKCCQNKIWYKTAGWYKWSYNLIK